MFPYVNKRSFSALVRYCTNKKRKSTKDFIEKVWDTDALHKMMYLSSTQNIDALVKWLTRPELDIKLIIIEQNINQLNK